MDNAQPQNPVSEPQQSNIPVPLSKESKPKSSPKVSIVVMVVVTLLSLALSGYLGYQNYKLNVQNSESDQATSPSKDKESSLETKSDNQLWEEAQYGGIFSFEYPKGWHVVVDWSPPSDKSYILIDPEPINLAPRGGPIATYQIALTAGISNPNEVFEEEKGNFNQDIYKNIESEILDSTIGPIYYFKGQFIGPYFEDEPVEAYYALFGKNENDPINQWIMHGSLVANDDQEISDMFRHIMLSIKLQ